MLGGRHPEILMVDCGTMQHRLPDGSSFSDVVASIAAQYEGASERSFLLTHFHKDHYCGLPLLLKDNPQYFDRIYLPCCPTNQDGIPVLFELSILIDAFVTGPKTETVRMNGAVLQFLQTICNFAGTESIFTLEAGDCLKLDGTDYHILWPPKQQYPFPPELEEFIHTANHMLSHCRDSHAGAFLELKAELCQAYLQCMADFSYCTDAEPLQRHSNLAYLFDLKQELNLLLPKLHTLSAAKKVRDLLCHRTTVMAVSRAVNGSSLILESDQFLLPGDATPETMDRIRSTLKEHYQIVKAPHHGTASCWWNGFAEMGIQHLLISNGKAISGGKIAAEYAMLNAIHHCTDGGHCLYRETELTCCNLRYYCPDCVPKDAPPTQCRRKDCGFYLDAQGQAHPCHCHSVLPEGGDHFEP